jgi:hypothetical protein
MTAQPITRDQLLDQASQFVLDPAGPYVLTKWYDRGHSTWVISDTFSCAQFLNMEGEWEEKQDSDEWRKRVLWTEPLSAASFYYGWRSRFYWVYVKGAGDGQWFHQFFSENREKAEEHYSAFQSKRPNLHWMLVGPDRNILREDVGTERQKWVEYPLNVVQ